MSMLYVFAKSTNHLICSESLWVFCNLISNADYNEKLMLLEMFNRDILVILARGLQLKNQLDLKLLLNILDALAYLFHIDEYYGY